MCDAESVLNVILLKDVIFYALTPCGGDALVPGRHLLLPTAAEVNKSAAKESGNQRFPLFCISPSYRFVHSPIPVSLLRPETKGAKASSYARFTLASARRAIQCFYLLRNHSK